jgi:hypothetical protein
MQAGRAGEEDKVQIIFSGKIKLEACSACQLRCPSCPTTTGETRAVVGRSYLRAADFIRLIDDNPWVGRVEISNYGEVFLNPELSAILGHAYARDVEIQILNGANLNHVKDTVLEDLVRTQVAGITCSIDGASAATYAQYRIRGDFDRVIANVRRLNAHKAAHRSALPLLTWQFVAFGHNQHEIAAARTLAKELDMAFVVKLSWDSDFSPVTDPAAVKAATGGRAASREEHLAATGQDYMQGICADLWQSPQINWDGKVLGCCRNFWQAFDGNAFGDGLTAALDGEKLNYARAMLAGKAEPRADIPCTACAIYRSRQAHQDWVKPPPTVRRGTDAVSDAWSRAVAAREAGKIEDAAAWSRVVLQLAPGHRDALLVLAERARQRGRAAAAAHYRAKAEAA